MLLVKKSATGKEVVEVALEDGALIGEVFMAHDNQPDMQSDLFINNEQVATEMQLYIKAKDSDILTIVYRPSGFIGDALAGTIGFATKLFISAAKTVLNFIVDIPNVNANIGNDDASSSSSNNSVSGQSNTVRKYEGIPNIYGRVLSYPDLIANSIPEWVSNRKQVRETFVIGEGEYQINQIRVGKTDVDDISETTAVVYSPNTYPSDLYSINLASEIDNENLVAPDDESVIWTGSATFSNSFTATLYSTNQADFDSVANTLTIDFTDIYEGVFPKNGETITISGTSLNDGSYTISAISNVFDVYTITLVEAVSDESLVGGVEVSFTRSSISMSSVTIVSDLGLVSGNQITTGYNAGPYNLAGYLITDTKTTLIIDYNESFANVGTTNTTLQESGTSNTPNTVGPFVMPTEAEQIWFNLTANNGLQSESGGSISITVRLYVQEIDENNNPVGLAVYQDVTLTGDSTTQVGQTVKLTGLGGIRAIVYAERLTNRFTGSAIQDVYLEEVFTVNSYSGENFGNVTLLDVVTKASRGGQRSGRNINCDVTRKIDGVATTSFADVAVHLITTKGLRPLSEINTDELYEIADSLSDNLKEFSYTFDDKNMSLGEAVQYACSAARVQVYRDGQEWRFIRDEEKPRTYIFNRRNLASGNNQTQTFARRQPSSYDSVSVSYYDWNLESQTEVYVSVDFDNQLFIEGELGSRPNQVQLVGCSNYEQALNRAYLEARRIVYQTRTVEDIALSDALNVDIGERVSWCDIYDGDVFDGEITGFDGDTYYTSEELYLQEGVTYYALVDDADGNAMNPVEVTASTKRSFTASLPSAVALADFNNRQTGSRYIIGSIDDIDDTDYLIAERGAADENGRVSISLVQYSPDLYLND